MVDDWDAKVVRSKQSKISTHQCPCSCSCCTDRDVRITMRTLDKLKAEMIEEGDKTWQEIVRLSKDQESLLRDRPQIARFLIGYKVIGVDRSSCWSYVDHDMWCKLDSCACNVVFCSDKFCVCACQCCSRVPNNMTIKDSKIYKCWLYYARQLHAYIEAANDAQHKKCLLTIDPWSLQEKWACGKCNKYSIVEVYNNKDYAEVDVFHVCLSCLTISTLQVSKVENAEEDDESIVAKFVDVSLYDLC